MYQTDFPASEFAERRARVFDRIGEAVALLQGAGPVRGFELFRQTNEFYYLSGVEVPQAYLLLDGRTRETALFLPRSEPSAVSHDEPTLASADVDTVLHLTGVDSLHSLEHLGAYLSGVRTLYTPHRPAEGALSSRDVLEAGARLAATDPWEAAVSREAHFAGLLRARQPEAEIRDLSPILDALRLVKSPQEIEVMRRSAQLSGLAATEAMRATRPGVIEGQLGAVAEFIYQAGGARGSGYRAIIAGGENIWFTHYFSNDQALRDGDLVLMDTAPDYRYYTSDIGRMWPVNGCYSDVQRELYGFAIAYHQALLRRLRPGVLATDVLRDAAEEMACMLARVSMRKPVYEEAARRMLSFAGHLSHPVGMAVHDVGDYRAEALPPGLVLTIDPQMWVPEERLYIRCEDTVVITEEGCENLTGFVPLEMDEVEALMQEDGLLDRLPAEVLRG
jgi:Xaa-Pro aminopeptidase